MSGAVTVIPVRGLPEIRPGDDLAAVIGAAVRLQDGDVVVVAQKVVSKAEGAVARPRPGEAPEQARRRLAMQQAVEVVADSPWALIVRTRHGLVCANAGVDASNVERGLLTLLPRDPDASARRVREGLADVTGADVAVIVADTFGRPWRTGQTDVAIGTAGLDPIRDERGGVDRLGRALEVTETAVADELAAAADLVRTKAEGVPVVVVRGVVYRSSADATAQRLVRDARWDLFPRGAGMLGRLLQRQQRPDWPAVWEAGATAAEVADARRVAPDLHVTAMGPPATLRTADPVAAGLAAAVLADHGLRVRWRQDAAVVILEAGRPGGPR